MVEIVYWGFFFKLLIDSDLVVRVGVVVCGRGGGWLRKLMVGEKNSLLVIVVEKLSI